MIEHKLSFQERITRAIENDPGNPKLAKIEHLAASYARLDIAAIMEKVQYGINVKDPCIYCSPVFSWCSAAEVICLQKQLLYHLRYRSELK